MITNFFICLSVLLSIITLLLVLAVTIPGFDLVNVITSQDVLNLLGVSITGASFMIACYFVLKAVDAYSQLKEITRHLEEVRVNKEKLKREIDTLSQTRNEAFSTTSEAIKSIFTHINKTLFTAAESEAFSPEAKNEIKNLIEISEHSIGRLSFIKYLPRCDRINYLQKLGQCGNKVDQEDLEKLIHDPTENEEIRSCAAQAYEKIEELLEEKRRNQNSSIQS